MHSSQNSATICWGCVVDVFYPTAGEGGGKTYSIQTLWSRCRGVAAPSARSKAPAVSSAEPCSHCQRLDKTWHIVMLPWRQETRAGMRQRRYRLTWKERERGTEAKSDKNWEKERKKAMSWHMSRHHPPVNQVKVGDLWAELVLQVLLDDWSLQYFWGRDAEYMSKIHRFKILCQIQNTVLIGEN